MWVLVVLSLLAAETGKPDGSASAKQRSKNWQAMPVPQKQSVSRVFEGYKLKPDRKHRRYIHDGAAFRATIHSDGTVAFKNKHGSISPLLGLPIPQPLPPGTKSVESEVRKLLGKHKRPKPVTHIPQGVANVRAVNPNRPNINDECLYPNPCFNWYQPVIVGVGGTFDITDEIMRMVGDDPYRYEKARFLAATLEFRTAFGTRNREDDLREAINDLPKLLRAIWGNPKLSLAQKRATILEIREDMDTSTDAGRKGVKMIDLFVERQGRTGRTQK